MLTLIYFYLYFIRGIRMAFALFVLLFFYFKLTKNSTPFDKPKSSAPIRAAITTIEIITIRVFLTTSDLLGQTTFFNS